VTSRVKAPDINPARLKFGGVLSEGLRRTTNKTKSLKYVGVVGSQQLRRAHLHSLSLSLSLSLSRVVGSQQLRRAHFALPLLQDQLPAGLCLCV